MIKRIVTENAANAEIGLTFDPVTLTFSYGANGVVSVLSSGGGGSIGPRGPQGPQGTIGPIGLTGATGPQGTIGPIGLTGATGPQAFSNDAGDLLKLGSDSLLYLGAATALQFAAATPGLALTPTSVWGAGAEQALVYAPSIAIDLNTGINFGPLVLTGNVAFANFSNLKPGQSGRIRIVQDSVGSRTISYGSFWKTIGGVVGTLSTLPNSVDIIYYDVISSTVINYYIANGIA